MHHPSIKKSLVKYAGQKSGNFRNKFSCFHFLLRLQEEGVGVQKCHFFVNVHKLETVNEGG